ncbi:uncharacterized protein LOC6640102 [Drosophila willistoni]|uniref:GK21660 n=1 Tax=Drosophila willistoni TaxID=7260 RepID=B4MP77_DROWI|nr:uncharacterized protein LOC6640102 [Drosophila willistoni]
MMNNKQILKLMAIVLTINLVLAYPQEQQRQRLIQNENNNNNEAASQALSNIYRYERTLSRLRRALEELVYEDETNDDMDLAEINVFRPLFRYRAEIAKQVKNPQRQSG